MIFIYIYRYDTVFASIFITMQIFVYSPELCADCMDDLQSPTYAGCHLGLVVLKHWP